MRCSDEVAGRSISQINPHLIGSDSMDFMYLGSQRVIGGDISGAYAAGVASEDILKLIKPGGLKPDYDEGQRDARAVLADVFNPFHVLTGPPVSGKTWTIISVPSELLHENNFKVVVVAPTDYVLDEFAVRIFDEFQEHDNLKKKIICRAKSINKPWDTTFDPPDYLKLTGSEMLLTRKSCRFKPANLSPSKSSRSSMR